MYDIEMYDNLTIKGLKEELQYKLNALNSNTQELNHKLELINNYKKWYAENNEFKFKAWADAEEWECTFIIDTIEQIKKHITAIKENINTYEERYNKKFGRKSPVIKIYLLSDMEAIN